MILYQLEIIKFIHKLMIVSKLNRSLTRLFIKWLIHWQFLKFLRTKQRYFIAIGFHWIPVQHQIKISVVTFFVLIIFAVSISSQNWKMNQFLKIVIKSLQIIFSFVYTQLSTHSVQSWEFVRKVWRILLATFQSLIPMQFCPKAQTWYKHNNLTLIKTIFTNLKKSSYFFALLKVS